MATRDCKNDGSSFLWLHSGLPELSLPGSRNSSRRKTSCLHLLEGKEISILLLLLLPPETHNLQDWGGSCNRAPSVSACLHTSCCGLGIPLTGWSKKLHEEAERSWEASTKGIAEWQKERGRDRKGLDKGALETLQQISISQAIRAKPQWAAMISASLVQTLLPEGLDLKGL